MGIFDFLKGSKGKDEKKSGPAAKWVDRAGDKRAQAYDRMEAIAALADIGSSEAAEALLRRFTFTVDPQITDQEEKDIAFRGVLKAGTEAIEAIRAFAKKAESLAWPMRLMKELLSQDEYEVELLSWLERWDTEYAKFIDPKFQLLATLEEHHGPAVVAAVTRFLDDVNETARFHTVGTMLAQRDEGCYESLLKHLPSEESVRIRDRIAEGLAAAGWTIPDALRNEIERVLPSTFRVSASGTIVR